jgi:hypothetical protein
MEGKILALLNIVKVKTAACWSKFNRPTRAVLILGIFAGASLMIFWLLVNQEIKANILNSLALGKENLIKTIAPEENIPANYIRRHLDGVYVDPADADFLPIAAMIDNDPLARPQSGLAQANIVYEAKAESGITRYLAIFATSSSAVEIGPVRSARPYYLDWAEGYGALYTHVGGSPEALAKIKSEKVPDINEFYQGQYFWRTDDYAAPHNIFTSLASLKKYAEKMNLKTGDYDSWLYKDEAATEQRASSSIEINFSVHDFLVNWKYNTEKNEYVRYLAGAKHQDADGTPIIAKNIVIMQVKSKTLDAELRREMTTIGEGKAWYCFDGICETGKWRKESKTKREKIYNSGGEEARFNASTTWIEVIQEEGQVSI